MSPKDAIELHLSDEHATTRLAQLLAPLLTAGDTVLFEGEIGAGKTHFCRSLIQARLGHDEDVPSPTFTLVQSYDADVGIVHADLYRLTHPDEARELGLDEAFQTCICLVEWPDRLGHDMVDDPIHIGLSTQGDGRLARIDPGARPLIRALLQREARSELARNFLHRAGWQMALREPLSNDASSRRYERLTLRGETRLLMDAPLNQADSVIDFAHIDGHLRRLGLSAPRIDAADFDTGFLLIEDFGNGVFAHLMRSDAAVELPLYMAATDVLLHLQSHPPATGIPRLTDADWARSADLVLGWYRFAICGERGDSDPFVAVLQDHLSRLAGLSQVMILRDYHAENLMWLPERQGLQRVGLLDFQQAQVGQPGYDLVSLLQDARRDVAQDLERQIVRHFIEHKGLSESAFSAGYACLGALRALRILGIFARLCLADGKPGYVDMMPRVWGHLQRNLAHPALHMLAASCKGLLPEPTAANLVRIKAQCRNFQ
jgi:tRNA threonylcarbamoyl adenosine modification protein YjeE